MDIVDKRVVVTGAASGIGKALAVEFKNEKAKDVVLADLNEEVLKVAEELGFSGFVLNVGKEDEVKDLISFANEKMGGIDIFCSNAGIGGEIGLLDVTTEAWQTIWDVNFMAHAHAAKHLIPQMLDLFGYKSSSSQSRRMDKNYLWSKRHWRFLSLSASSKNCNDCTRSRSCWC